MFADDWPKINTGEFDYYLIVVVFFLIIDRIRFKEASEPALINVD